MLAVHICLSANNKQADNERWSTTARVVENHMKRTGSVGLAVPDGVFRVKVQRTEKSLSEATLSYVEAIDSSGNDERVVQREPNALSQRKNIGVTFR